MADIVIFNYGQPRHELNAWLLSDQGLVVDETSDVDEALRAVRDRRAPAVLLNSREPQENIAPICHRLRAADHVRIIYPVSGDEQARTEHLVDCDVCVRYTDDTEEFVREIRRVMAED